MAFSSRNQIQDPAASWLDRGSGGQPTPSSFSNPPPGFSHQAPGPAQAPPLEGNPILSMSQSQAMFPPQQQSFNSNFQGDYPAYGSSFYPGGNPGYPSGHPQNVSLVHLLDLTKSPFLYSYPTL